MNVTKYSLGTDKAKTIHNDIIDSGRAYSLTVTLNPYYNSLPVHEQYRHISVELIRALKEISPYYNIIMCSPEFTKDYNIHFHCYLTLPTEGKLETFEQNWKRVKMKSKYIGKMYKLKYCDEITEILRGYPFKDIERTKRYSQIENCLFTPNHYVIRSKSNNLQVDNSKYGCDILKFIEFVNSQKNI